MHLYALVISLLLINFANASSGLTVSTSTSIIQQSYLDQYTQSYGRPLIGLSYDNLWVSSQSVSSMGITDIRLDYYDATHTYVAGGTYTHRNQLIPGYSTGVAFGMDYINYDELSYGQLFVGAEATRNETALQLSTYLPTQNAQSLTTTSSNLVGMPGAIVSLSHTTPRLVIFAAYGSFSQSNVSRDVTTKRVGGIFRFTNLLVVDARVESNSGLSRDNAFQIRLRLPLTAPAFVPGSLPSTPMRRDYGAVLGGQS